MANLKRPGGELASRPLHFIWVVDCSGSMYGEKIGTVNHAIQSTIPEMADAAKDNPNAQLLVRTLKFSTGASWVTTAPVPIEDFAWDDLDAGGVTDLGKAFEMLADGGTLLVADGHGFTGRPCERIVPYVIHARHAPLDHLAPALVVVVVDESPLRVEDEARRGGQHVADVRAHARPGGAVVRGGQLKLRRRGGAAVLRAREREDAPVAEIDR